MEIKTNEFQVAKIDFNFEEVKSKLKEFSEKYVGLVVTEENIKDTTTAKNELAALEKHIDDYRKAQKKELETPIKEFENKCKELLNILKEVSDPIREQLEYYENVRKEEKEKEVQSLIDEVAKKYELEKEFTNQLVIIPKYLNKTQKEKDTVEDLELRAKVLKEQQEQKRQLEEMKKQKLDLIQKTIEEVNKEFETDLKISEFNFLIDKVLDEIPKTIRARANYIYQERRAEEQKKLKEEIEKVETVEVVEEKKEEIKQPKLFNFSLKIENCTGAKAKLLKEFLENNDFEYNLDNK
ncbi:DUF1351 domain-containing protein [Fusobacterium varium]|jgi:hypothetical protein